ncbi:hypothetical protein [Cryptosporangium sp. NPDC051539]
MSQVAALLREYDRARAHTDDLWKDLRDTVAERVHARIGAIAAGEAGALR